MLVQSMPYPAAGGGFILGPDGAGISDGTLGANVMVGLAYQAASDGTLRSLHVRGADAAAGAGDFRLALYAATDANTWGAKLAETVRNTDLGISELRSLPLNVDVPIVAGNWYAPCYQSNTNTVQVRRAAAAGGRFYSDSFADGAAATALATSNNGVAPCVFGTSETIDLSATAFTIGQAGAGIANTNCSANMMIGSAFVSNHDGEITHLNVRGSSAASSAVNYRLVIYAATDANTWGAKLGETAVINGLGVDEVKSVALDSPASVSAGDYYAICLQAESTMAVRNWVATGGRYYADSYSDGAATSASATANFGPKMCVWASAS